jgi:hypothetical protein
VEPNECGAHQVWSQSSEKPMKVEPMNKCGSNQVWSQVGSQSSVEPNKCGAKCVEPNKCGAQQVRSPTSVEFNKCGVQQV